MIIPRNALASALLLLTSCTAPVKGYFMSADKVTEAWNVPGTVPIGPGNGAFMSLDGETLAVIDQACTVTAYDPASGTMKWTHAHGDGTSLCSGGLWFTGSYVAFSPISADLTSSTVTGLSVADGTEVFTTGTVEGAAVGTPVTSSDGTYIIVTSNNSPSTGVFNVFNIASPGTPSLTYQITSSRVSAVGAYWSPVQGYYTGGFDNMNDVFYFGLDVSMGGNATTVGDGQIYAYQIGIDTVTLVGDTRDFQSGLPPVIGNSGLNMYWSVTRSQLKCWAGTKDLARDSFNNGATNTEDFTRGKPAYSSALAPPVVTSGATPMVYGPSAANEIFGANNDCSVVTKYTFPDATIVLSNKVLLSVDEAYLYAADEAGNFMFFSNATLAQGPTWTFSLGAPVNGELAISSDGLLVYIPDVNGGVRALAVSDTPITPAPGSTPNITAPAPTPVFPAPVAAPVALGTPAPGTGEPGMGEPTMTPGPTASFEPSPSGGEEPTPVSVPGFPSPSGGNVPVPAPVRAPVPAPTSSASAMATIGTLVLAAFGMILV